MKAVIITFKPEGYLKSGFTCKSEIIRTSKAFEPLHEGHENRQLALQEHLQQMDRVTRRDNPTWRGWRIVGGLQRGITRVPGKHSTWIALVE